MADLGKLWFELGIRDNVSKETEKIKKGYGDVDAIIKNINVDLDKNSNAMLSAFNKIAQARRQLSNVYEKASYEDKKKIDEERVSLDKLFYGLMQIWTSAEKMGRKGLVSDFLNTENFAPKLQRIQQYTAELQASERAAESNSKAQLQLATNAEKVQNMIDKVSAKKDVLSELKKNNPLGQNVDEIERAYKRLDKVLNSLYAKNAKGNIGNTELSNVAAQVTGAMQAAANAEQNYARAGRETKKVITEKQRVMSSDSKTIRDYANSFDYLSQKAKQTNRILSEIQAQVASTFSLYSIERFVKSLITIGGEFEKQHIALKSMLGDAQQANEIFSQIKSLAPISPFTFRDLTTYAKQLTAFNIPFEELYDTTKRLSDISAGLGVDMGRIILAYGQVRSASVLRGQELRQFTEAGIPIVQALADKLTKMNGTLVTTGEVFDYISKRKVPFEMVKEVLWDLTDESGRFYNMQMVLSDTLAGKWANLQDSWEIMLSNLANSDTLMGNLLKTGVTNLTKLINLVNKFSTAAVAGGIGSFLGKLLTNALKKTSHQITEQVLLTKRLTAAQIELNVETSKQTALQSHIVSTKGRVTAEDIAILTSERKITQMQLAQLINANNIDRTKLEQLLVERGISAEEARQLSLTTATSAAAAGLVSILSSVGWVVAVGAVLAAVGHFWEEARKATEKAQEASDNAAQRYENLNRVLQDTAAKNPQSLSDIKKEINGIEEALKNIDPYLEKIKEQHKNDDERTYYEALRKELDLVTQSYKSAAEAKELFERLNKHGLFEESVSDNFQDWTNSQASTNAVFSKAGRNAILSAQEAIKELAKTDKLARAALYDENGKERTLDDALRKYLSYDTSGQKYHKLKGVMKKAGQGALAAFREGMDEEANDLKTLRSQLSSKLSDIANTALKNPNLKAGTDEFSMHVMTQWNSWISSLGISIDKANEAVGDMFRQYGVNNFRAVPPQSNGGSGSSGSGNNDGTDNTDQLLKKWKEQFSELKKFYSQYKKWAKDIGKDAAIRRLREKGIFDTMFDKSGKPIYNIDDWRDALQKFSETLKGGSSERNKFKIEVGLEMDDFDYDENHEKLEEAGKRISEYLSDEVSKYNLYESIFKKTGSKEFAMNAFVDGRVWDDVSRGMAERLAQMLGTEVSKIDFDADSITMEKALEGVNGAYDIWKKIVEITRNNYNKSLEDAAEATSKLLTISEQIAIKEAEIEKLKKDGIYTNERILVLEKEIHELRNKAFKQSADYLNFYNSILSMSIPTAERIGQAIKDNLNEELFKGTITAKQYTQEIKRVNDQLKLLRNKQSDFSSFMSGGLNSLFKNQYDKAESDFSQATTDYAQAAQDFITALRKGDTYSAQMAGNAMSAAKGQQAAAGAVMQGASTAMNTVAIIDKIVHGIDDTIQGMRQAFEDIKGMFDALGSDTESNGWQNASAFFTAMSEMSKGATSAWDSLKNGNIMGVFTGALHSITGPITAIAQFHDKKLDHAIQKSQAEVKKLENAYKDLETTITERLGGIYSSNVYDKMMSNLRQQRAELKRQMELEDEKKKTNKDKMEDYRQSIKEADEEIKNFAQDMARSLYDIDVKSWAKQLTDAVVSAWAKGEDAAEAFHDKVREIVQDLTKNILTQKIMEQALQPVLDNIIAEMDAKSGRLDEQSIRRFAESLDLAVNSAVPTIENILNQLQAQGWDFSEKSNESSGLSKSISGMSEDTGNLVASYLNATRADVSVIRSILESAYGAGESSIAKAQLYQLESIASYTSRNAEAAERIEKMFRSVTEGSNKVYVR